MSGSSSGLITSHVWTYRDVFSGTLGKQRTFKKMADTLGILDLNTIFVKSLKIWGPKSESNDMFASFFNINCPEIHHLCHISLGS